MNKPPLSLIPLLPITTALVGGIIVSQYLWSWWTVGIVTCFAIISAILRFHYQSAITVAVTTGIICGRLFIPISPSKTFLENTTHFVGIVREYRQSDSSQSAIIKIIHAGNDSCDTTPCRPFYASIIIPAFSPEIELADEILFTASLQKVTPRHDLPDETDYADILLRKNVYVQAIVPPENIIDIHDAAGIINTIKRMRSDVSNLILQSGLKSGTKEFLNATITGDSSTLPDDMRKSFSSSGIAHILALSGLHVGIIAMILTVILWWLHAYGYSKLRTFIIIAALWLYAILTGLSPSVTRAVIMATIFFTAMQLQRRSNAFNSLCFAAIAILVFDPAAIFSISFQLSFASVASILLFAESINPIPGRYRITHAITSYICISIAAMLGTALISAIYFHSFPVYFILTNVIVCLILPFLIGGGIILIFFELTGYDPQWLCIILDNSYNGIEYISKTIASLPGAVIDNIYIPWWMIFPYTVTLAFLKLWLSLRRTFYISATVILLSGTIMSLMIIPNKEISKNIYIARRTYRTDIIINTASDTLHIITTDRQEPNAIYDEAYMRYNDYMRLRHISSINVITSDMTLKNIQFQHNILSTPYFNMALINNDSIVINTKINYAVICRGYKGNMEHIINTMNPDTVIIGYDLHPRRHDRYEKYCLKHNIAYISMRHQPFSLPLNNSR